MGAFLNAWMSSLAGGALRLPFPENVDVLWWACIRARYILCRINQ